MWLDLMYRFVENKYLGVIGSHRLYHGLTWRKPRNDGADIPYLVYYFPYLGRSLFFISVFLRTIS